MKNVVRMNIGRENCSQGPEGGKPKEMSVRQTRTLTIKKTDARDSEFIASVSVK